MKKIILLIIAGGLFFTGCHEFTNPVDPYLDLVAYYPLEGNGNNKIDLFSSAKIVSAELTTGHFDDAESAYAFSGDDSYMDCGSIGVFDGDTNLSISLWVKQDGSAESTENIFGKYNADTEAGYYLYVNLNRPMFEITNGYSSYYALSADTIDDDLWHHIVVIGEKVDTQYEISLYVDGIEKASTLHSSISYDNSSSPLVFGAKYADNNEWAGTLDNIRVYGKAVSALDVQKLFLETEADGTDFDYDTLFADASSGSLHSLFLKKNGELWSCGDNSNGQLGDGTTVLKSSPVKISTLTGITAADAGYNFSLALKSDGTVYSWGLNTNGQLGLGDTTFRSSPVRITALSSIKAIAAGNGRAAALDESGNVWNWGSSIGNTPVQVAGLSGVKAIAVGDDHYLALKEDGTVVAWGDNSAGELGNGTTSATYTGTPSAVLDLAGVTAVSAGTNFSTALKNDGTVWSWGTNSSGQLGDGYAANRYSPVQLSYGDYQYITGVKQISSGYQTNTALLTDGTVWSTGYDGYGELGTIDSYSYNSYFAVQADISYAVDSLGDTSGSAGFSKFALDATGQLIGWGRNSSYQLGLGDTASPTSASFVPYF